MATSPKTAGTASTVTTTTITITDVQQALYANLQNLKPGISYTLQGLVGDAFWHSMSTGTRKHLGVEFKALVRGGSTPVDEGGRKTNNCHL